MGRVLAQDGVKSVKEEYLSKLILFGEKSLRHALREYVVYYHHERNHQGKENLLLFPASDQLPQSERKVCSRERLGGLLRFLPSGIISGGDNNIFPTNRLPLQCIYLDPPYGIKFNSNFQWSTTSRDVKDGKAGHITREPEQVKAFLERPFPSSKTISACCRSFRFFGFGIGVMNSARRRRSKT